MEIKDKENNPNFCVVNSASRKNSKEIPKQIQKQSEKLDKNINPQQSQEIQQKQNKFLQKRLSQNRNLTKKSSEVIKEDPQFQEKLNIYFKYKIASLASTMGFNNYFMQHMNHRKDLQMKYKQFVREKNLVKNKCTEKQYLEKLKKEVYQKSKYRYRQKQDMKLSLILKTLNYDPRTLCTELQEKAKSLDLYKDMEDEDEKEEEKITYEKKSKLEVQEINNAYRKKHNIRPDQLIFIIKGGYPTLQEKLTESDKWVINPDMSSYAFDLKFTTRKRDIDYESLLDTQYINKYQKNTVLTSKHGLARSLKNLVYLQNFNTHQFHPRCYDLIDTIEFQDFIEDFKFSKVESILKKFQQEQKSNTQSLNYQKMLQIMLAVLIIQRKMKDVLDKIKDIQNEKLPIVSPWEWKFMDQENIEDIHSQNYKLNAQDIDDLKAYLQEKIKFEEFRTNLNQKVEECLTKLQKWDSQYNINGKQNIWIVKPAGLSRGRGIKTFNDLEQLLFYVMGKDAQWVAQKYIENPLTIERKKFDIRQWVIVTDWDPLTLWFYDECYIRICSQEYKLDEFSNPFAHLTNNCIQQKNSEQYTEEEGGVMMTMSDFSQYVKKLTGKNIFEDKIQPKLKESCKMTMKAVADQVQHRSNSFEMYGFDYMIDENFDVWLIEVNSSPTMEYSTKVTEYLVPKFLNDNYKLLNNYITKQDKNQINKIDVGQFSCIYRQQQEEQEQEQNQIQVKQK